MGKAGDLSQRQKSISQHKNAIEKTSEQKADGDDVKISAESDFSEDN